MQTAVLSTADISTRYGRGYLAILALLAGELRKGASTTTRARRRASNTRAEELRVVLVTLLQADHFMVGELAAETVVTHIRVFREDETQ
ncbi:hypothetical protein [Streptomyces sp. NPDC047525]|uniref:hypothetical protein n=1 Tax=Streptomyces sp. NPDC047525 TaxID=3155264 RepID=UPI00340C3847